MPIVNRDVERKIVEAGRAQGKSDDFIKQAVTRYREQNGGTTQPASVQAPQPQEPGLLKSFAGGVADLARQPANYFAKIGTTIGDAASKTETGQIVGKILRTTTDITPEQAKSAQKEFYKPSIFSPRGQSLKPFESGREFVGESIKTAVNLSTPFIGEGRVAAGLLKGIAPKVAQFGKQVVPRALEFGAGAAGMQVGENIEEGKPVTDGVLKSFAIGAALPIAGTGFGATGRLVSSKLPVRNEMAERVINSFVKPIQKFESYGKNPAKAIVEDIGTFGSFDEGVSKAIAKKQEIGSQMDAILTSPENSRKGVTITESLKPFDEAINKAVKQNNQPAVSRLEEARKVITDILELDKNSGQIVSKGQRQLAYLSPFEANKIKQEIGDITKYTGNPSDDKIVNDTLQKVYSDIRNKINDVVPEMAPLNERWGNLKSAELAMKYREQLANRQNLLPLGARITGIGSLLFGITTLNPLAIAAGILNFGLDAALSSSTFKTKLAQFLAKSTPQERQILVKEAPILNNLLGRIFGASEKKPTPFVIKREIEKAQQELLALPPGRSIQVPPSDPLRGDTSGIIKNAPPPTQLPVEPRPGQLQLPSGREPIQMPYVDKSGVIPNATPPKQLPIEPGFGKKSRSSKEYDLAKKRIESENKLKARRQAMLSAVDGKIKK